VFKCFGDWIVEDNGFIAVHDPLDSSTVLILLNKPVEFFAFAIEIGRYMGRLGLSVLVASFEEELRPTSEE
jgi:hypothetical protein